MEIEVELGLINTFIHGSSSDVKLAMDIYHNNINNFDYTRLEYLLLTSGKWKKVSNLWPDYFQNFNSENYLKFNCKVGLQRMTREMNFVLLPPKGYG